MRGMGKRTREVARCFIEQQSVLCAPSGIFSPRSITSTIIQFITGTSGVGPSGRGAALRNISRKLVVSKQSAFGRNIPWMVMAINGILRNSEIQAEVGIKFVAGD